MKSILDWIIRYFNFLDSFLLIDNSSSMEMVINSIKSKYLLFLIEDHAKIEDRMGYDFDRLLLEYDLPELTDTINQMGGDCSDVKKLLRDDDLPELTDTINQMGGDCSDIKKLLRDDDVTERRVIDFEYLSKWLNDYNVVLDEIVEDEGADDPIVYTIVPRIKSDYYDLLFNHLDELRLRVSSYVDNSMDYKQYFEEFDYPYYSERLE